MRIKILRRRYSFAEFSILRRNILKILLNPKKLLNFFLVRVSLLLKMDRCLGLPYNIKIEPTGNCNYRCIKCERFSSMYVDDGHIFDGKNMPFGFYQKIIDEIGDTLISIRLWHFGEPLLNKDIFRMIKYAKKKDIIVAMSSNLSLLTKESSNSLINSGLDYLIVSLDGASSRTYGLYHGRSYFNKVVTNIKTLVELKKRLGLSLPFIELQFIVMKENEEEIDKMRNLVYELGVNKLTYLKLDATSINFDKFEGIRSDSDILPMNKYLCFDMSKINHIKLCRIPWEEVLFRYSGVILPCSEDTGQQHIMGKLYQDSRYTGFRKIWNNDKYRSFRRNDASHINGIDICFNCTQRDNNINDQIQLNGKVLFR